MRDYIIRQKNIVRCDFCGRKIKKIAYICEHCNSVTMMYLLSRTKVWDTRKLFPDLCRNCAEKLDSALKLMQDELVEREKIMQRNTLLNNERRKKLNSKG